MSKRSKNTLLTSSGSRSTHQTAAIKDELLAMKYTMNGPNASIYPYDDYVHGNGGYVGDMDTAILEDDDMSKFKSKGRSTLVRRPSKSRPSPGVVDEVSFMNTAPSSSPSTGVTGSITASMSEGSTALTYPDYKPWSDHTSLSTNDSKFENEKITNNAYINKGYFEPPSVSNEYYSARNMIQNTIFSSTVNCQRVLSDLSSQLATTYKIRNESVNRIKFESNTFKLPPRVTLTASKREAWFRDLANPQVPLSHLTNRTPHGVRNKVLIDNLCSKFVPVSRAIWFTKCVLHSELLALRKKIQSKQLQQQHSGSTSSAQSMQTFENHWLQEWTQQVVEYIHKFSRDMTNISSQEKKHIYTQKLTYLLAYTQALYIELLLDKPTFLSLIIKFFVEGLPLQLLQEEADNDDDDDDDEIKEEDNDGIERDGPLAGDEEQEKIHDLYLSINYGQRLVALTIVRTYWNDILKFDYLCNELSESLLLNYYIVSKTPVGRKSSIPYHQRQSSQNNIGTVNMMSMSPPAPSSIGGPSPMYAASPSFNTPSSHHQQPHGQSTTHSQSHAHTSVNTVSSFSSDFKTKLLKNFADTLTFLVKFNANVFIIPNYWPIVGSSLQNILNSSTVSSIEEKNEIDKQFRLIKYRNESLMLNLGGPSSNTPIAPPTPSGLLGKNNSSIIPTLTNASRSWKRRSSKDVLNIITQLDNLKLNGDLALLLCPSAEPSGAIPWHQHLKLVLYWSATSYRRSRTSSESILIVCNFLKKLVIPKISSKEERIEFESEILDVIYDMADDDSNAIIPYRLYVLINELYQLKLLTISSYLRKLIASGIFYVDQSNEISGEDMRHIESHLNILKNLPVLNNKQCDSILRKWSTKGFQFQELFNDGKKVVEQDILGLINQNTTPSPLVETGNDLKSFLSTLTVGLKFLLVNWTTGQIKSIITNSPKLVHITPYFLCKLYEFYYNCDSLTVFFKVILRFILKNDGMVIIYYMDTLRLISRLILKHSKLAMLVDSTDNFELFVLLLNSYKDLSTREADYFNFRDFWKFMNRVIEKSAEAIEKPAALEFSPEGSFYRDTISGSTLEKESTSTIKDSLEDLLALSRQPLEKEEVTELMTSLNLKAGTDDVTELFKKLTSINEDGSESSGADVEISIVRLLVDIKENNKDSFFASLKEFISVAPNIIKFCQKLVMYDLMDISSLTGRIPSLTEKLVSSSESIDANGYENEDELVWKIALEHYYYKNPQNALHAILSNTNRNLNSSLSLESLTVRHPNIIIEEFTKKYPLEIILRKYEYVLGINLVDLKDDNEKLLTALANIVNEFNLPICQVLLKSIPLATKDVKFMTEVFISHLHLKFSPHNSYFGELFDYLDWEFKAQILEIYENMFLEETKFGESNLDLDMDSNIGIQAPKTSVSLYSTNGVNILPAFKDFFKKFSIPGTEVISTSNDLLDKLTRFSSNLLLVANDGFIDDFSKSNVYNAVCVFLRILIIHKQSLIPILVQKDDKFTLIKTLIEILNSIYFSGGKSEKLRILLYDLLLFLKGGISESITETSVTTANDIPKTPGAMGMNMAMTPAPVISHNLSPQEEGTPMGNRAPPRAGASASDTSVVQEVFNLPEPTNANPLSKYLVKNKMQTLITLDEDELLANADINYVNGDLLVLSESSQDDSAVSDPRKMRTGGLHLKSYELLEDNGAGLNAGCINLSIFQAYTTKQNPP